MSQRIFLLQVALIALYSCRAQHHQDVTMPEVGKPMPDFTLDNITHFSTPRASLMDFKGKWLILDFWFTSCAACIHSFPKVNIIHKEFKKELNWIMVGLLDHEYKNTRALYERIREKQKLEMPVAYDSALFARWNIHSMPYILIIDPDGIVRFITGGRDLTSEKIKDLLAGKKVNFYPKEINRSEFVPSEDAVKEKTDTLSSNLLYRSVVRKWAGERQGVIDIISWVKWPKKYLKDGYTISMVPLYGLYNYAYIGGSDWDASDSLNGKFYPKPILEICDTSLFQHDFTFDVGKGTYNYSLTIPPADVSQSTIMTLMQRDLKTAFKYDVAVETRTMPVWKLIAKPGVANKLKTKGGEKFFTPGSNVTGYKIVNWPCQYLIASLSFYLNERYRGEVFVDETGISGNIDFTFEADMTNMSDIRKNLHKQGLDLVRGTKELKVIVIRDSKGL